MIGTHSFTASMRIPFDLSLRREMWKHAENVHSAGNAKHKNFQQKCSGETQSHNQTHKLEYLQLNFIFRSPKAECDLLSQISPSSGRGVWPAIFLATPSRPAAGGGGKITHWEPLGRFPALIRRRLVTLRYTGFIIQASE